MDHHYYSIINGELNKAGEPARGVLSQLKCLASLLYFCSLLSQRTENLHRETVGYKFLVKTVCLGSTRQPHGPPEHCRKSATPSIFSVWHHLGLEKRRILVLQLINAINEGRRWLWL